MPELISSSTTLILWAAIGYLLGSIPTGVILAKLMGLGNLREIGSGNIGATNVLRTGNKTAAALTLLIDAGKGAIAVLLARAFVPDDAVQAAGLAAFIGHCFPIWLGFRGGKGVATYLGVIFALSWPIGLAACGIWFLVALVFRYSSLAAIMAAGWVPVITAMTNNGTIIIIGVVFALLIYMRHWANMSRLRKGTEPKIGAKPGAAPVGQ